MCVTAASSQQRQAHSTHTSQQRLCCPCILMVPCVCVCVCVCVRVCVRNDCTPRCRDDCFPLEWENNTESDEISTQEGKRD